LRDHRGDRQDPPDRVPGAAKHDPTEFIDEDDEF